MHFCLPINVHVYMFDEISKVFWCNRYYEGGRLSDQQMALLQYQRENLHFLSEEVYGDQDINTGDCILIAFDIARTPSFCG